jgi:hypothetical protein
MLRPSTRVFLLIAALSATRYSSAQNVHVYVPPAVPQAQDLHTPIPPAAVPQPGTNVTLAFAGDDIQKQQAIAANSQRQVEIRRDMEKMQQLTAELSDYLQKAERGVVSVDAIKKAEQIEKLAHSVKSKMKLSF